MSFLIQLLLPRNLDKSATASSQFAQVRHELTEKFGGVTVFSRAAADGLWESEEGKVERDEMVLFEVMSASLKPRWWRSYRQQLEQRFSQKEIMVRVQKVRRL